MMAILFSTGLILFSPENIIEKIYLKDFKETYGFVLGIVFIISLSILLFSLIFVVSNYFISKLRYKNFLKNAEKNLLTLNQNERIVIKSILETQDNTLYLPVNNGMIRKLEFYKIIGKAATTSIVSGYDSNNWEFPYLLQPWVFEILEKHPDYFDLLEYN